MDRVDRHPLFSGCPWKYADAPVVPVTPGILDKGHLDRNTARVKPPSIFLVTLTLGCGYTALNSQRSFNIFHVIEDTMRPLYPRERARLAMSLFHGALPAVAICLSANVSPYWLLLEGRRKKRMSVHPVSLRACACVDSGKWGDGTDGYVLKIQISQSMLGWEDIRKQEERVCGR